MTTMACTLSGMPIADGDDAVLVMLVATDLHDTPDEGVASAWVPVGHPVRGRHDGRGWVIPAEGDAFDAWTLRYVTDRMLFRGRTIRSMDREIWVDLGTVVLDACATLYGHVTPTGKVSGTMAAMLARADVHDALVQAWMAEGIRATPVRNAVMRYVVPIPGNQTADETERHEDARRATYESLGLGRETLRIVDEPSANAAVPPVPEVFRRAYEALALPCAMAAAGLAFAPSAPWFPRPRPRGYEEAVADRFRETLGSIVAAADGPIPEPVDLDWRPADPEGPYTLFLDDLRFPAKLTPHVAIARSSDEAIAVATRLGMPAHVDYDHDLGGDDTAMRFVNWLVDRVVDRGATVGDMTWAVHSSNPVGRDNIDGLMRNITRHSRELSAIPGP